MKAEVLPLPKFQEYEVAPLDVLVNCTVSGEQPVVIFAVKLAVTALTLHTEKSNSIRSMIRRMKKQ